MHDIYIAFTSFALCFADTCTHTVPIFIFLFSEVDPLKSLNEIIPDLKQILFWMSNALEMLHFLQDNLSTYLPGTFHVNSASNDPEEEALANADEELLNVLEEVAMFTFQQTVYHLTKV